MSDDKVAPELAAVHGAPRALHAACPACGDPDVHQVVEEGRVYWCARGWADNYPSPERPDSVIVYCPWCGWELDEAYVEDGERS